MPLPDWAPERDDVARLLMARSRTDRTGDEAGTFDDSTRPTGEAVDRLIAIAVEDVIDRAGGPIPEALTDDATRLTTYRVGVLIERSYFPDQVRDAQSPHRDYQDDFDGGIMRLQKRLHRLRNPPAVL